MVPHVTPRALRTGAGARVDTLLIDAGLVLRAFGTNGALRPTSGRAADEGGQAGAHGLAVGLPALAVGPTRRGLAGVPGRRLGQHWLRWDHVAEPEGVAGVARPAGALRQVVHHLAVRVLTTGSRARVLALVPNAGPVGRAVRVDGALGVAALVRVAQVLGQAGAGARSVKLPTNGVGTARAGLAGVEVLLDHGLLYQRALRERVSSVAHDADAPRRVADHPALSVLAARPRARVPALLVDAGQVGGALAVGHALWSAVGRRPGEARMARTRGLVT